MQVSSAPPKALRRAQTALLVPTLMMVLPSALLVPLVNTLWSVWIDAFPALLARSRPPQARLLVPTVQLARTLLMLA